jgi:hypothetical protein
VLAHSTSTTRLLSVYARLQLFCAQARVTQHAAEAHMCSACFQVACVHNGSRPCDMLCCVLHALMQGSTHIVLAIRALLVTLHNCSSSTAAVVADVMLRWSNVGCMARVPEQRAGVRGRQILCCVLLIVCTCGCRCACTRWTVQLHAHSEASNMDCFSRLQQHCFDYNSTACSVH